MYAAFSAVCFLFVFVLTQHKSIFEVSIVYVCVVVVYGVLVVFVCVREFSMGCRVCNKSSLSLFSFFLSLPLFTHSKNSRIGGHWAGEGPGEFLWPPFSWLPRRESFSSLVCSFEFFCFFFLLSVVAVLCQQGSAEFVAEVWFEGLQLAGGLSHVAARDQILGEGHRLRQVHHAVPPTMRDEDDIPCLLNQLQRPRVRFEQRVNFVEPSNRRRRVVHHSVVHRPREIGRAHV